MMNRELEDAIAARAAVGKGMALEEENSVLRAELAACKAELAALKDFINHRFASCTYCGFRVNYLADNQADHDRAVEAINAHALTCDADPNVRQLAALKAERGQS